MSNTYSLWNNNNLLLQLHIQTRAAKDAIIGEYNNRLKISITTAPEDGKANNHLIKFLAKHFGVPQKQVQIIKGTTNKYKTALVIDPQKNFP